MFGAPMVGAAANITLNKTVSPASAPSRGRVTYTITLNNSAPDAAGNVEVIDFLPAGFSYVRGTSRIYSSNTLISSADPVLWGQTLSWRNLKMPAGRQGSYYGIHTFIQDRCDSDTINYQLDRALELMGPGAFVKQLFYYITPELPGPLSCWVDFVNRAYDRGLTPVVRLQGVHGGPYWLKPQPDAPGNYTTIAQAYKRVVAGLPKRDGRYLYVEIWNEPNLDIEWSGAPNPQEYGEFLVDVAAAIRSLGDPRVRILNGGLSPGGNYNNLAFIDAMAAVPGALDAFDVWSSHPYPGNHPPEYNIHDGTAAYRDLTIDSYLLELERLARHGRTGLQVILTETGYALGQNNFGFEGYAPIGESNRADYIRRALRDYWRRWPEILGVCPYELVDPYGDWWVWDWLYPDGRRHEQYDAVAGLAKEAPAISSRLTILFQAIVAESAGVYYNQVAAVADGVNLTLNNAAPVSVYAATPPASPTAWDPNCSEGAANGDMEGIDGWTSSGLSAYSSDQAHSGQRSMRIGIVSGANSRVYSSASQFVAIPAAATSATLSFWYYPLSGDLSGDLQLARLYENGNVVASIMREPSDARQWQYKQYDLTPFAGRTIQLYFGVYNDGQSGATAMYLDDVSALICAPQLASPTPTWTRTPSATPTRTLTPTQTRTAAPSLTPTVGPTRAPTCLEQAANASFEVDGGWEIPFTARPAEYTNLKAHSGGRSLALGITEGNNVRSYSSARQLFDLPADATQITLAFWYLPLSEDEVHDRQYVLILDEQNNTLETLMWVGKNDGLWLSRAHSLTGYAGRRIKLHFGVYNDGQGGITAMYLDDVSVQVCWGGATPIPTATPILAAHRYALPLIIKGYNTGASSSGVTAPAAPSLGRAIEATKVAITGLEERIYRAEAGKLSALDARDGRTLAEREIGSEAHALLVNSGRLYLTEREEQKLWVLDAASLETLGVVEHVPQPGGLALLDGRLYLAATGSDELWVLDADTLQVLERLAVGRAPYAVAVNPLSRYVLVANAGSGSVTAINRFDTASRMVVSLGGLGYPQQIITDPQTAEFHVSYLISPKESAVAVIDGESGQIVRVLRAWP